MHLTINGLRVPGRGLHSLWIDRPVLLLGLLSLVGTAARADWNAAQVIAKEIGRGQHPGIESFVLVADDAIVSRYVSPELTGRPPDLRSATKSITALLIGIAIDRGEVPSVDAGLVDLLPARRELLARDPLKATLTVRHLLNMRSGLARARRQDVPAPGLGRVLGWSGHAHSPR